MGFSRQEHEWVAISFSSAWKWKVKEKSLSRVQLFETPWTAAYQVPPSMGFSRQEHEWGAIAFSGIVYREVQSYSVTKTRKKNTVIPLHMNLKLQTVKDATEHSIRVRHEWNCSLPSIPYCWCSFSATISPLLSLLQSVTLLASSLDASPYMPTVVLYYCTFWGIVL